MNIQSIQNNQYNISNRGKFGDKVANFTAEVYGKHIANSEPLRNFCEKMSKKNIGDVTTHMQVLGSAITSATYMQTTMKNKNFDKDNARTLAVNQFLCFVIPTIGAYVVDRAITDLKKQMEYNYAAKLEKAASNAIGKEKDKILAMKGNNIKGVRILLGILTTTLLYRYITPVAVTPLANKIGNKMNAKKKAQQSLAADEQVKQNQVKNDSKEILLEPKKELRVSA